MDELEYERWKVNAGRASALAFALFLVLLPLTCTASAPEAASLNDWNARTAVATERLATLQAWVVTLTGLILIGLAATVYFARNTARATIESVRASTLSLRPHLFVERDGDRFILRNVGKTPAIDVNSDVHVRQGGVTGVVGHDGKGRYLPIRSLKVSLTDHYHAVIAPDQTRSVMNTMENLSLDDPSTGSIYIAVRYDDTFGGKHWMLCSYGVIDNGGRGIIVKATESTRR